MANVAEHVREKDRLRVVNDDISPGLLKAICGRLDLFIGTRMHSNIFATAMTTPTFAISYQPKTDGIMRMLDMERWKAPIAEITADSLRARLAELWSERASVRAHLAERIPAIQDQATCDIRNTLSQLLETRPNI
jgi:colanic acid/amylovoran biosynthesis protein